MRCTVIAVALLAMEANAIDNGLGLTPPMGWRSWNFFGGRVDQKLMTDVMDAMVVQSNSVDGTPTSLKDLGFTHVGLDDNWQACGQGYLNSFHDENGVPLINTTTFPSMKDMTAYGQSKGLQVGWYGNNCICAEHQFNDSTYIAKHMQQTAAATAAYGYDGIKLDGCGQFRNLTWWASLLNETGRPTLIENCHWGQTVPGQTTGDAPCTGTTTPSDCPYNFFRTSGDIQKSWGSMMYNLQTTVPYLGEPPLSRPGTWAYPDMLEVGNLASHAEDRTHFGAWAIVSAPLVLGHDVTNATKNQELWDIIGNTEVIAVNQDWAGHPGSRIHGSDTDSDYQVWTKPLTGGAFAALVINNATQAMTVDIPISQWNFQTANVAVRDLYNHATVGSFSSTGTLTTDPIPSHDSRFYKISPSS